MSELNELFKHVNDKINEENVDSDEKDESKNVDENDDTQVEDGNSPKSMRDLGKYKDVDTESETNEDVDTDEKTDDSDVSEDADEDTDDADVSEEKKSTCDDKDEDKEDKKTDEGKVVTANDGEGPDVIKKLTEFVGRCPTNLLDMDSSTNEGKCDSVKLTNDKGDVLTISNDGTWKL